MSVALDSKAKRFFLYLLLLLVVDLSINCIAPDADPPLGYSSKPSQLLSGFWYQAQAKAWALDQEVGIADRYCSPALSFPVYCIYSLSGVSIAASKILGIFSSFCILIIICFVARKRYGESWALFAGMLFVLSPAWHALVRSSSIFPWVGLWTLVAILLGSARSRSCYLLSLIVIFLGSEFLHPSILIALPAVLQEGIKRFHLKAHIKLEYFWAASLAALYFGWNYWHPTANSLWTDLGSLESRTGIFSSIPFALSWCWIALLLFSVSPLSKVRGRRSLSRALHLSFWTAFAVLCFSGARAYEWMLMLTPVGVLILTECLCSTASTKMKLLPLKNLRLLFIIGIGLAGTACLALQMREAAAIQSGYAVPLLVACSGASIIFWLCFARFSIGRDSAPMRVIAFLVFLLPLVVYSPRIMHMMSHFEYSLKHANRELEGVTLPTAYAAGPFAHALTLNNERSAQQLRLPIGDSFSLKEIVEKRNCSHLAIAHAVGDRGLYDNFAAQGVQLYPISVFHVMKFPVHLYRVQSAKQESSAYELGTYALHANQLHQAEWYFSLLLDNRKLNAAAWTALAKSIYLRTQGGAKLASALPSTDADPLLAFTLLGIQLQQEVQAKDQANFIEHCLHNAIAASPYRINARLLLAKIRMEQSYYPEAIHQLRLAISFDPLNIEAQSMLEAALEAQISAADE